jgi:predicted DCC family thiol-disulfide oxidoreductase YuxK
MTNREDLHKPVVFYDGGCPLCRREISHYRRIDDDRQLCGIDIHAHPEMLQAYGLTLTQAMQRMHVMESDGRLVSGAAAFIAMWRRLPRYRSLAWVVSSTGVFWLAEKPYSRFARWRWKGHCDQVCGRP